MIFLFFIILTKSQFKTATILGTNDIHGKLISETVKTSKNETVQIGGLSLFSSYLNILRKNDPNLLWIDAGDQFTGTLESQYFDGKSITHALNYLGLNSTTTGNHDFDFGHLIYEDRLKQSFFETVDSNISPKYDKTVKYSMHTLENGIIIGVIGLLTKLTPITTSTDLQDYQFQDYIKITKKYSALLKKKGAHIVVVECHLGMYCTFNNKNDQFLNKNRTSEDPSTNSSTCNDQDELFRYVSSLDLSIVDAVISGHTHSIIHHFINGIPIVQALKSMNYFNMIQLTYDEETFIEGPIPVCDYVFTPQLICDAKDQSNSYSNLVQNSFRGQPIQEDAQFLAEFKNYTDVVEPLKNEKIAYVENAITKNSEGANLMGILFCDVMMEAMGDEFCLTLPGSIRISFDQGDLLYDHIFQGISYKIAMPFKDDIVSTVFTGKELLKVFRTLYTSNNSLYIQKGFYIDGISKKFIHAQTNSGQEIDPKKEYRVSMPDFFLSGGDDFAQVRTWYEPREMIIGPDFKDALKKYAKKKKILNSKQDPLFDPKKPLFKFIKKDQYFLRTIQ